MYFSWIALLNRLHGKVLVLFLPLLAAVMLALIGELVQRLVDLSLR